MNQAKEISMDVIRILLSILIPPLGVFLQVGLGVQFWLNILLTLLGYIPGVIHAIYIIVTRPERERSAAGQTG
jgi:uncharacterized membrane protein YqaE (UPF0057 family)